MTLSAWRLALSVALVLPGVAIAKDRPVRDRVIAIVHKRVPAATITPADRFGFTLKLPGKEQQQISVERIADYCSLNTTAECDMQVANFAESIVAFATQDFTVTRARLRVIVRNKRDTDGYLATMPEIEKRPLVRPLFDDVSAVLAADFPRGTRLMTAADLTGLGLTADQAFDLGVDQALADLPKPPALADVDGKIVVISGFDYGASSLLRPDRWQALATASGGRLYVAIPSDDAVIIGTTRSDADLPKLREMVSREYALAARGVSPFVYRWSPAGWVATK